MKVKDTVCAQFVGNVAALITPARIGMELYRFFFVRNHGHPAGSVAYGIFLDRLYDFLPIAFIFVAGLPILKFGKYPNETAVFGMFLLASVTAFVYLLSRSKNKILDKILDRFKPESLLRVEAMALEGRGEKIPFSTGNSFVTIIGFLFFSVLVILVNTLRVDFFTRSLGLNIGFMYMLWCVSALVICNYLPISVMGVGTRDVLLIYLLSLRSVGAESAVFVSSLILVSLVLQALIGVGIYLIVDGDIRKVKDRFVEDA